MLTPDERELGVALVDVGGGTADLAIFERGSLWHTAVVAVGGDHGSAEIGVDQGLAALQRAASGAASLHLEAQAGQEEAPQRVVGERGRVSCGAGTR